MNEAIILAIATQIAMIIPPLKQAQAVEEAKAQVVEAKPTDAQQEFNDRIDDLIARLCMADGRRRIAERTLERENEITKTTHTTNLTATHNAGAVIVDTKAERAEIAKELKEALNFKTIVEYNSKTPSEICKD